LKVLFIRSAGHRQNARRDPGGRRG
jgi:hypothetical protein